MDYLLNSIDENAGVGALDYANMVNLAIDDVNVSMCEILRVPLALRLQMGLSSR